MKSFSKLDKYMVEPSAYTSLLNTFYFKNVIYTSRYSSGEI